MPAAGPSDGAGAGALSPARRAADLDVVAGGRVDVVVVGGGVTGAGVALDAVSRGLSVVLLERADLASGTSRWSSKLVHGGLRYLAHGEIGLARESARERAVLMRATAPHLVRPLAFLVPDAAGRTASALAGVGGRLGDVVRASVAGGRRSLPGTRRVGAAEVARLTPGVRGRRGGVVFWDGQLTDDARLVVALARTAAASGARVLTGAAVRAVDGADVHVEMDDGEALTLRAGVVVNATGVWAQHLAPGIRLVPSRGSHLVVPAERLGSPSAALTVPLPGSRSRYVFALPQPGGLVHVGLTDEPVPGPVPDEDQVPSDAEVQELLDTVNQVLTAPLTRTDVVGCYAGLRPLVRPASAGAGPGGATADLSRKHLLRWDGSVLTVVGGKLTTYRAMAEEAVDAVVEKEMEARAMGIPLTPEERFEVFGEHDPARYEAETEERWGGTDAYAESKRKTAAYSKDDWVRIKAEMEDIGTRFVRAMQSGVPADSVEAMDIAEAHRRQISRDFYECTPEIQAGLGRMYVEDERFAATYERMAPGLAQYVSTATQANAARQAD